MRNSFSANESGPSLRLQESPPALPAQPETPDDGHLAGLLTYASGELEAPSRVFSPIHANIRREMGIFPVACCSSSQRIQLRGSGGFKPPSRYQMKEL
jgi:hypothetical protein